MTRWRRTVICWRWVRPNLLSGLFHGMLVGAGYSATSSNEETCATSRLSGWITALGMLAIVW